MRSNDGLRRSWCLQSIDEEERGSPAVEGFSRSYVHVTAHPMVIEKDDYGRSVVVYVDAPCPRFAPAGV
jgi:hypothetical protein